MNLLGPSILEGKTVRLEPLRLEHADGMLRAATSGVDWTWFLSPLKSREDVVRRIEEGIAAEERNEGYAYAVRILRDGQIIGSTSYLAVSQRHRRVEIGSTWYSPSFQGTSVNPECKFLLLRHAFEDWGAVRVQFVTDTNNLHSQRAILKLSAKFEGKLRNYGLRTDGTAREVFLYSLIPSEWRDVEPSLKNRIESLGDTQATGTERS